MESRLGRPEVVERIAAGSSDIFKSEISSEEKNAFFVFAKEAILKQGKDLEGDARYELLSGSFLSGVGLFDVLMIFTWIAIISKISLGKAYG